MTERERDVYMLLCMAGREREATDFRDRCEGSTPPRVADVILEQLGGNRFSAMTGSKDFLADGNTLRMTLVKNKSKANRLFITLDEVTDTYIMRFFYYFPGRLNKKTWAWSEEKTEEVAEYEGVYAEDLRRIFTMVTGLETSLGERSWSNGC